MSSHNFINKVINNLKSLVSTVSEIVELTPQKSKSQYSFRLSNYKKWLLYLQQEFVDSNNSDINNAQKLVEYIKKDKPHYKGIIKRIEELELCETLKELDKYNKQLLELKPNMNDNNNFDRDGTNNNSIKSEKKNDKIEGKELHEIEAIPKKLAEEGDRPSDPIEAAIYDMRLLFGFGPANARKVVEAGCRLDILLNEWKEYKETYGDNLQGEILRIPKKFIWLNQITHEQLVGVKYFHDISEKIPRAEIIKMEKLLKLMAKKLNSELQIQCCGSYRRGRDRSGDIDALMCHPDLKTKDDVDAYFTSKNNILQTFVDMLTKYGFVSDHLTHGGTSKFMGLCKIPKDEYTVYRRIDIRFVPYHSYGTALLYFTGSKNFNTDMRKVALSKGYTLSEYGIFEYKKNPETKKKEKGKQIPTITEEDVFDFLKMKYKTPKERDI